LVVDVHGVRLHGRTCVIEPVHLQPYACDLHVLVSFCVPQAPHFLEHFPTFHGFQTPPLGQQLLPPALDAVVVCTSLCALSPPAAVVVSAPAPPAVVVSASAPTAAVVVSPAITDIAPTAAAFETAITGAVVVVAATTAVVDFAIETVLLTKAVVVFGAAVVGIDGPWQRLFSN